MDDATRVGRGEALADLRGQLDGLARRQRAAAEAVPQGLALQQLEHDVRLPVVRPHVVDGEDAGVPERGHRPGLLLEAPDAVGRGRPVARDHLDRDLAAEARVAGPIDLAHPARTEGREDLVGPEARARGEWQ